MSEFKPIKSNNLEAACYDPQTNILIVKFKNGTSYQYPNFPADVYRQFEERFDGADGKSAGQFFSAYIRHLPNEKVEE